MAANITKIWLILQTSGVSSSGTSDNLELQVERNDGGSPVELNTNDTIYTSEPDLDINQKLSTSWATQFSWTENKDYWSSGDLTTDNISKWNLEIEGDDLYLPRTVWVITYDSDGNYDVAVAKTPWSSKNCFSTDSSECPAPDYDL